VKGRLIAAKKRQIENVALEYRKNASLRIDPGKGKLPFPGLSVIMCAKGNQSFYIMDHVNGVR